ncbi:MAG: sigma 54-interacting transcriptional regulator [Deltaproteobacteria bacterium]|nr:sigma 54-interacting transcriptional regulator [Deltaproteobacteria bacterium]
MAYLHIVDTVRRSTQDVALRKPILTLGRKQGADVVLDDASLAPVHANLVQKGGGLTVSVVEHSLELYVNGHRVRTADLSPGDTLLLGRFEIRLEGGFPPEKTLPQEGAGFDTLQQLVDFSRELMRDTTPEALFHKLLRSVVGLTRAEKGFVIVFQDGERHLAASHNVGDEHLDLSRISDSIVDHVVRNRLPLVVSDALHDRAFSTSKSVVDLRLSSVLCVPLIYREDLLGVIYLGNDNVADLFTERDLSLLEVFASQAAILVHTALMLNQLQTSNRNLRDQLRRSSQGEMVGSCPSVQQVFRMVRRVAPTDLSVLILGETGTGKELVAREIHRLSDRSGKAFVSINCGAIPENLLESELFGHKKGSFTGAMADKMGKFELAAGGTIFLDEICEMPMHLQVKLLRVLQERRIERIGELQPRAIDFRLVAATNKPLDEEIKAGRFREDLFYRLNEVVVQLPPLRERGEDILLLARYFLNKYAEQAGSRVRGFTNECIEAMNASFWPGNVRQLESRVKRAVIMSDRPLLNPADLGLSQGERIRVVPLAEAEEEFKRTYVREVLERNNWNKAQTARDLDVDPRTIFRYVEKLEAE